MTEPNAAQAPTSDFELTDREDEQEIIAELNGALAQKFVYKNSRGLFELSYSGTKWAVRELAKRGEVIRVIGHPKVERCPIDPAEHIVVTIQAERVQVEKGKKDESQKDTVLEVNIGAARGWIKQKLQDGRIIPDEFFFNKTISKAIRNGQQALMSQEFKKEMIDHLSKMQNGQQSAPPQRNAGKKAQQPPANPPQDQPPAGQTQTGTATQTGTTQQSGTQAGRPAGVPPSQNQTAPPAGTPPTPLDPKEERKGLVTRFVTVLKQAVGAKEDNAALQLLPALLQVKSMDQVSNDTIKKLGPIIQQVAKKQATLNQGVVKDMKGVVLWQPPPPPQAETAPPPSDQDAPPEGDMF